VLKTRFLKFKKPKTSKVQIVGVLGFYFSAILYRSRLISYFNRVGLSMSFVIIYGR